MSLAEDLSRLQGAAEVDRLRIASDIEAVARRIEAEIIQVLLHSGAEVPSPQVLAQLYASIQAIVDGRGDEFAGLMDHSILTELRHLLAQQSATFRAAGIATLDALYPRQAAVAWLTFERQIADRTILTSYEPFRQLMWDEWRDHWAETVGRLKRRFTRAMLTGESINSIVPDVAPDLTGLALEANQDPETFAKAFVRTKMTELHTTAAIQQGQDAFGADARFANAGVMDTRQSQVCFEASVAGLKTLAEWADWVSSTGEGGLPPRHVFYCRCTLLAVAVWMLEKLEAQFRARKSPRWEATEHGSQRKAA